MVEVGIGCDQIETRYVCGGCDPDIVLAHVDSRCLAVCIDYCVRLHRFRRIDWNRAEVLKQKPHCSILSLPQLN